MGIVVTDACVRGILDAGYDATFPAGSTLEIRSGPRPGPGAAPAGVLLWSKVLAAAWMAASAGRAKGLSAALAAAGLAAGDAAHYRLKAPGDTGAATQAEPRQEGSVTAVGGGGDMEVSNVSVAVGQNLSVLTFSVGIP